MDKHTRAPAPPRSLLACKLALHRHFDRLDAEAARPPAKTASRHPAKYATPEARAIARRKAGR